MPATEFEFSICDFYTQLFFFLDSRIESLQLSMAEVLKPQCSRSKKSYKQVKFGFKKFKLNSKHTSRHSLHTHLLPPNVLLQHISMSEVKVDKVQVNSGEDGTTFAVCLDQDEKKFIQKVTRYSKVSARNIISLMLPQIQTPDIPLQL